MLVALQPLVIPETKSLRFWQTRQKGNVRLCQPLSEESHTDSFPFTYLPFSPWGYRSQSMTHYWNYLSPEGQYETILVDSSLWSSARGYQVSLISSIVLWFLRHGVLQRQRCTSRWFTFQLIADCHTESFSTSSLVGAVSSRMLYASGNNGYGGRKGTKWPKFPCEQAKVVGSFCYILLLLLACIFQSRRRHEQCSLYHCNNRINR